MIKITVNNFDSLEKKVIIVDSMDKVESRLKRFFNDNDIKISLVSGKYIIKNDFFRVIGAALIDVIKEYKEEIKIGDVLIADLGEEDGTPVQAGERRVIVVSNNICNKYSPVISVVSATSQNKNLLPTHVQIIPNEENRFAVKSTVLCEQIIPLPKSKIKNKCGRLNSFELKEIQDAIKVQLAL